MNLDYTMGIVIGAACGAVLVVLFFRRQMLRMREAQRLSLDVELREAKLKLREERSEMELSLKMQQAESERLLASRENTLADRTREIERQAERLRDTEQPSPGEARKLEIAFGLAGRAWLLVLDEPTNHLDLPAIQSLEAALAQWPGTLLLVSHDEAFAARCTSIEWAVEHGKVIAR